MNRNFFLFRFGTVRNQVITIHFINSREFLYYCIIPSLSLFLLSSPTDDNITFSLPSHSLASTITPTHILRKHAHFHEEAHSHMMVFPKSLSFLMKNLLCLHSTCEKNIFRKKKYFSFFVYTLLILLLFFFRSLACYFDTDGKLKKAVKINFRCKFLLFYILNAFKYLLKIN